MVCNFISLLILAANIILAQTHDSKENITLKDASIEEAQNDEVAAGEPTKLHYAKLVSNERSDLEPKEDPIDDQPGTDDKKLEKEPSNEKEEDEEASKQDDSVTIISPKDLEDLVLNNKDKVEQILKEAKGKDGSEDDSAEDNSPSAELYRLELNAGTKNDGAGTNPHSFQPHEYKDFGRRRKYYRRDVNEATEDTQDTHLVPKLASPELVLEIAKKSAQLEASKPFNPTDGAIEKAILRSGNYWNSVWKEDIDPQILRSNPSKPYSEVRFVPEKTEDKHLEPKLASPNFVLDIAKKSMLLEASKHNSSTKDVIEKSILRNGNSWNSIGEGDPDTKVLRSYPSESSPSLGVVRTKINPGSKLYELIKRLNRISPRLIYVINKKSDDFY